jgi:hypothetical protein
MFYIKAGALLAGAMTILGFLKFLMGVWVALQFEGDQMVAASKRYLGTVDSGEAIDRGLQMFAAGIVIGLLVHIAKNRTYL